MGFNGSGWRWNFTGVGRAAERKPAGCGFEYEKDITIHHYFNDVKIQE